MKRSSLPRVSLLACFVLLAAGVGCVAPAGKSKSGITVDWGKAKDESKRAAGPYTPEGLREAFAALCKSLGYRAHVVEIDQTEAPFLVYGVLAGPCDYRAIRDQLGSMPGYAYSGSVTRGRGDDSVTIFALNMIPREYSEADPRRTMDRMRELAERLR
jgi:hypothetical protein